MAKGLIGNQVAITKEPEAASVTEISRIVTEEKEKLVLKIETLAKEKQHLEEFW